METASTNGSEVAELPIAEAPPLLIIPAQSIGITPGRNPAGDPIVMVALRNPIAVMQVPFDLAQAGQLADQIHEVIAEARGLALPPSGLVTP